MLIPKKKKQVKVVKAKPVKKTTVEVMGGSKVEPPLVQENIPVTNNTANPKKPRKSTTKATKPVTAPVTSPNTEQTTTAPKDKSKGKPKGEKENKTGVRRRKANEMIEETERAGYRVPQAIKDALISTTDDKRVDEIFKMLGGNLNTSAISIDKNLYIKVGKENEFLKNVGLSALDIDALPQTYGELSKVTRKSSTEYMDIIKGVTDTHTRIASPRELRIVVNDILSENVNIAKKNKARPTDLTVENIEQLEINKQLKKDFGSEIEVATSSVADDLVSTLMFRFGAGKQDVQVSDIYKRLKTHESVGYQLSSTAIQSGLNSLLFNRENKLDSTSINRQIKSSVKNDVANLRKSLEETGQSEDEIQARLKEYEEDRTSYYKGIIKQTKDDLVSYVREKMVKVLSDIQSSKGVIDAHTSLKLELTTLINGLVETNDDNINKVMDKIKSKHKFTDTQLDVIRRDLIDKIGNKLFMTRSDLETLATQVAYDKGYFSESTEKVKKLLIEKFTDQERLKNWSESQLKKYGTLQDLIISNFIDTLEDRLAGHPSWEQCKDLFYTELYNALLNAFNNLGMSTDEVRGILNRRKPEYKDQLYIAEYGERWITALFDELKYSGNVSQVISALKSDTGWSSGDYRRAYWTGRIKDNPATTSEKNKSNYKK